MLNDLQDRSDRPVAVVLVRPVFSTTCELVVDVVRASGFDIPGGPVGRALDAVERAADLGPALLVVDLVQAGPFGDRLVSVLRTIAPWASIQVLVPFSGLGLPTLREAADGIHLDTDLRGLRRELSSLASSLLPQGSLLPGGA